MKIRSLKLVNFRNYKQVELKFNDNLNIIYGNNGCGKTNVVESIYALSLTKSFRTNEDKNLIKKGELSTKIEGEILSNTENNYQVIISKEGKKVKIDDDYISKISDYIANIKVIVLEPDAQTIFNDTPASRRKLLNIEISQLEKDYLIYLNNYNKILKQRNFYLKELFINGNASLDYLNILTTKLIESGKKISDYRLNFIDKINEYINNYYQNIFSYGNLKVKYISEFKNKSGEDILKMFNKNYQKEVNLGKSYFGIHHDDIEFILDNKNIREWGSNGQQKNAIFAFKLAELDLFYQKNGLYPILILDDLFSAIDNEKIKNIIKLLNENVQTFITTTDLERIPENLINHASLYEVKDEMIVEDYCGRK